MTKKIDLKKTRFGLGWNQWAFFLTMLFICQVGCETEQKAAKLPEAAKVPYPNVTALAFPESAGITLAEYEKWSYENRLKTITDSAPIDENSIETLQKGAKTFDVRPFVFDDKLVAALYDAPELVWLQVDEKASSTNLKSICQIQKLRGLILAGADLTGADLSDLGLLKNLKLLSLSFAELPDSENPKLPSLPELEALYLLGASATDEWLPIPGQFPNLKTISLGSSVTDAGLARLVKANPKLICLFLGHTRVTKNSIDEIAKLKHLQYIHIGMLNIHRHELQKKLPKCFIDSGD